MRWWARIIRGIETAIALQRIFIARPAGAAEEDIISIGVGLVAVAADHQIISESAVDRVVAVFAANLIITRVAEEEIVAAVAVDLIGTRAAVNGVISRPAADVIESVDSIAARAGVVARIENIIAAAAKNRIDRGAGADRVSRAFCSRRQPNPCHRCQ